MISTFLLLALPWAALQDPDAGSAEAQEPQQAPVAEDRVESEIEDPPKSGSDAKPLGVPEPWSAQDQDPSQAAAVEPESAPEQERPADEGAIPDLPTPFVDGAGPIAPGPVRPPQFLNAVQMIVNEECITATDVFYEANRESEEAPVTREETNRLLQKIAGELTKRLLKEQAGRDLGYETDMIEALVRDEIDSRRERAGSVSELARRLDLLEIDSAELKENTRKRIYMTLWEGSVSGNNAGSEGRHYVDRYVRPGQLRQEFLRQGRGLALPATILMEEMLIVPDQGEPLEAARQRAEIVHRRLEKGEDFVELNAVFGIPGRSPELNPIEESKLQFVPDIKAFVDTAEEDDISAVLPVVIQGQPAGFRILRFIRREVAEAQSFVDREFQDRLAEEIQSRRSAYYVDRALVDLLDAAYIWPNDSLRRGAPGSR